MESYEMLTHSNNSDSEDYEYYQPMGTPIELGSRALINAIYGVDNYILRLEGGIKSQDEEIKQLKKEAMVRLDAQLHDSQVRTGRMLDSIINYCSGEPPINEGIGLDTVLILKHLNSRLADLRSAYDGGDDIEGLLQELEDYIAKACARAKALPTEGTQP